MIVYATMIDDETSDGDELNFCERPSVLRRVLGFPVCLAGEIPFFIRDHYDEHADTQS